MPEDLQQDPPVNPFTALPEVVGSDKDPYTKDVPLNLDEELEFSAAHMTKAAFTAKIIFITIITVILFTMFVAMFFFIFTAKVEKRVVQKSIQSTVESIFKELNVFLTTSQLTTLTSLVQSLDVPDMAKADREAKQHNDALMKKSFFYLGIGAAALLVVLLVYYFVLRHHAIKTFGPAATRGVHYPAMATVCFVAGMGFVGVVVAEFVFLYLIAARYQPLDSYKVRRDILSSIITAAYCKGGPPCPPATPACQANITVGEDNLPVIQRACVNPFPPPS